MAPVTVPRPINNLLNKSVKAHAVSKYLTKLFDTNSLPRVIWISLSFVVVTL